MFKMLLRAIGLSKGPAPLRTYLSASPFVGALPALAFVAWRYRDKIGPMLRNARALGPKQAVAQSY